MRVLVAPDKFRGTLSATEAARAIAQGVRRALPQAEVDVAPMADGGEGTLDALVTALGGSLRSATVTGPLGDPVRADYGVAGGGDRPGVGIVEMARASGLALLGKRRNAVRLATTRGTGELILAASAQGVATLVACLGGSATNDGGAGMAQALGVRLLDGWGSELPPGGAALLRLARIDATGLDSAVRDLDVVVATDVDNPLTGAQGASFVYGPQKGATSEDVVLLDRALGHFAAVIHRDLGVDVRQVRGAGAAGGLGAGMVAFLGARLRPGVEVVMEAVGLRERMEGADLVVTGEGRFDAQSLRGKVPDGVLAAAAEAGVPALVLCGDRDPSVAGASVVSLVERFGRAEAMSRPALLLAELAAQAVPSSIR